MGFEPGTAGDCLVTTQPENEVDPRERKATERNWFSELKPLSLDFAIMGAQIPFLDFSSLKPV